MLIHVLDLKQLNSIFMTYRYIIITFDFFDLII